MAPELSNVIQKATKLAKKTGRLCYIHLRDDNSLAVRIGWGKNWVMRIYPGGRVEASRRIYQVIGVTDGS